MQKGNIHVPSLYDPTGRGPYWYWSGVNWVAAFSWMAGVAFGLPGLIATYQPQAVSQEGKNMYTLGWILTFTASSVIYFTLTRFVKLRTVPEAFQSVPLSYEYLSNEGREGFFDGEREALENGVPSPVMMDGESAGGEKGSNKAEV